MKKFFIWFLIVLMYFIGIFSTLYLFNSKKLHWFLHLILLICESIFLLIPALRYWERYFKNLFNEKDI